MPRGVYGALSNADIPNVVILRFMRATNEADISSTGCWLWPKSTASHGYGQIGWGGWQGRGLVLAHRLSYVVLNGTIPEGMTVDHVCRERRCFNPNHLRLLTNLENARDNGPSRRTHCPYGHPYDEDNTRVDKRGHRRCIACQKARNRARAA